MPIRAVYPWPVSELTNIETDLAYYAGRSQITRTALQSLLDRIKEVTTDELENLVRTKEVKDLILAIFFSVHDVETGLDVLLARIRALPKKEAEDRIRDDLTVRH